MGIVTVTARDASGNVSVPVSVSWSLSTGGLVKPGPGLVGATDGLTRLDGDQRLSTPGQTIQDRDIYGFVKMDAPNTQLINCHVRGRDVAYTNGGNLIDCSAGHSGVLVQNCTIKPDFPRWWLEGIYGGGYTLRACDVSDVVDAALVRLNSGQIIGNWFHDFYFSNQSEDQRNSSPPKWTHNDGIQFRMTTTTGTWLVQGNNFDWYPRVGGVDDQTAALRAGYAGTYAKGCVSTVSGKLLWGSGITSSPDLGANTGITVVDNWFEGGTSGFQMNALNPTVNGAVVPFGEVARNKFGMDQFDYGNGSRYQIRYSKGNIITNATTNIFDPDAASVPAAKKGVAFTVGFTGGIRIF